MTSYEDKILVDLKLWQYDMTKKPSLKDKLAKSVQNKMNNMLPEKFQSVVTSAIKNMVQAVLLGSEYTNRKPILDNTSLYEREKIVQDRLNFYKKAAVASGAGTGAGGIILGLADFPILLGIKMKYLFETASIYGFNVKDVRERLYILHIFQLAFSSPQKRKEVYEKILYWDTTLAKMSYDMKAIDWRVFQQEYRDYLDIAKLLQMLPVIGAVIGAYANYKLLDKLGETSINCYRLRLFKD